MKTLVSPAIVLRHTNYRDADRVVTFMTRDFGRLSGLARGVRRSVRRFGGRLDLFSHVELTWRPGRGELVHLESAKLINAHLGLRNDLPRMAWAGVFSELVERLFQPDEVNAHAFDILAAVLSYSESVTDYEPTVVRLAGLHLLSVAGFRPELRVCVRCRRPPARHAPHRLDVSRGGIVCHACVPTGQAIPLSEATLDALAHSIDASLEELADVSLNPALKRELKDIFQAFVTYHVGEPLKASRFLAHLEAGDEPEGKASEAGDEHGGRNVSAGKRGEEGGAGEGRMES